MKKLFVFAAIILLLFSLVSSVVSADTSVLNGETKINDDEHKHRYECSVVQEVTCVSRGEYLYACSCGDSYVIYPTGNGHYYVNGECGYCGQLDPKYDGSNSNVVIGVCNDCSRPEVVVSCLRCGKSITANLCTECHFLNGYCSEECAALGVN